MNIFLSKPRNAVLKNPVIDAPAQPMKLMNRLVFSPIENVHNSRLIEKQIDQKELSFDKNCQNVKH